MLKKSPPSAPAGARCPKHAQSMYDQGFMQRMATGSIIRSLRGPIQATTDTLVADMRQPFHQPNFQRMCWLSLFKSPAYTKHQLPCLHLNARTHAKKSPLQRRKPYSRPAPTPAPNPAPTPAPTTSSSSTPALQPIGTVLIQHGRAVLHIGSVQVRDMGYVRITPEEKESDRQNHLDSLQPDVLASDLEHWASIFKGMSQMLNTSTPIPASKTPFCTIPPAGTWTKSRLWTKSPSWHKQSSNAAKMHLATICTVQKTMVTRRRNTRTAMPVSWTTARNASQRNAFSGVSGC
jgi:hypothetical protein